MNYALTVTVCAAPRAHAPEASRRPGVAETGLIRLRNREQPNLGYVA